MIVDLIFIAKYNPCSKFIQMKTNGSLLLCLLNEAEIEN